MAARGPVGVLRVTSTLAALALGCLLVTCWFPGAARAQTGGDVVYLRDGGVLRGTVVEHVPGDHTTVLLLTGETRTIAGALVERVHVAAPPSSGAGLAVPREPDTATVRAERVRVRVRTDSREPLFLFQRGAVGRGTIDGASGEHASFGVDVYSPLCEAPCELELEPGLYEFGIARGEEEPTRPPHARFEIRHERELRLNWGRHSTLRTSGWIMFFGGFFTGGGMVAAGILLIGGLGLVVPGAILAAFSLVYWLVAAFQSDDIDMRSDPLTVRF